MFWGKILGRRAEQRRWKPVAMALAWSRRLGPACPRWHKHSRMLWFRNLPDRTCPASISCWAAVLIGVAVIILVAQQITHRLALRREAGARGDLSRRLIEARERLATGPFALIEWSGAGAIELEPRAAELLSLNRPQTTLEEVRGLLQNDGPNAEETWAALLAGKGAAQAVMRHVHTGRRLRLQRPEQGGARRLWLDDVGDDHGAGRRVARGGARLHGTARPAADADLVPRREPRHHLWQPGVPPPARPAAGRGAALAAATSISARRGPRRPRAEARLACSRKAITSSPAASAGCSTSTELPVPTDGTDRLCPRPDRP